MVDIYRSFALTGKLSYEAKVIEEDNRFKINSLDTFKQSSLSHRAVEGLVRSLMAFLPNKRERFI
jgi:hypothetical protein